MKKDCTQLNNLIQEMGETLIHLEKLNNLINLKEAPLNISNKKLSHMKWGHLTILDYPLNLKNLKVLLLIFNLYKDGFS